MKLSRVKLEVSAGIASVTLARQDKLNAFDLQMFVDISRVIDNISKNKLIRVVVIQGAGSDFSTGLDIKSVMLDKGAGLKLLWKWWPGQANLAQKMSVGWRRLSVPVVVAIQGRCWGAGLQLALGGDFRFISPDANLSIMESRWGLIPDMGGSLALRELVRLDKALEWTMTSKEIKADEAVKCGLATKTTNTPREEALSFAKELLEKSPDVLAATKKLFRYGWHHNDNNLLAREWFYQWRMLLGKNRGVAVARAKGKTEKDFLPRTFS